MVIYTRKPAAMGISIVPMLDILTILLIFFIVHTEFKRQVSVLDITLPQTHNIAGEKGDKNQILLEVADDGTLALDGNIITLDKLSAAVHELRNTHPDTKVQVSAARGASMGRFIQIMDILTAAGLPVDEVPVRIDYQSAP
ncbi:MAG: biopolymer transporter ExbD [Akkermansia sp.]|nr:biopolymer transporter ExbD [Akkermansia sp.]